ncbi:MAG: hypothetical protein LJE68_15450 [Rhodobacter sp.]|nr:hypothetical protein [Rhodobacter sp.]
MQDDHLTPDQAVEAKSELLRVQSALLLQMREYDSECVWLDADFILKAPVALLDIIDG